MCANLCANLCAVCANLPVSAGGVTACGDGRVSCEWQGASAVSGRVEAGDVSHLWGRWWWGRWGWRGWRSTFCLWCSRASAACCQGEQVGWKRQCGWGVQQRMSVKAAHLTTATALLLSDVLHVALRCTLLQPLVAPSCLFAPCMIILLKLGFRRPAWMSRWMSTVGVGT